MTADIRYLEVDGRRIAWRGCEGAGPPILFLPGYMSDMAGSKATALFDWAQAGGRRCLLLDYSGCGVSDGDFADGTLLRWRDEVLALLRAEGGDAPPLIVGSSMGGWLMLLVALALQGRVAGLVGIAAAPDFTQWGFSDAQKAVLAAGETLFEDNAYGPDPTPTHAGFWASGQASLLLDTDIPLPCPVRLLQGQRDEDVPWDIALHLSAALGSADVQTILVKDGDHRLSRPADIALLLATVGGLLD